MSPFEVLLLPLGWFAFALVLVVVAFVVRARGRRRRAGRLGEWAARHGWGFVPRDDDAARARPCFPVDRGGRSAHVLAHPSGTLAFEWAFIVVTGTGESRSRREHVYSVVSVPAPAVRGATRVDVGTGPARALRRARKRDPDAVDTGVPSFDARFVMTARDPGHAARLLPPAVLDGFATDPRTVGVGLRIHDGTVTVFRSERLTPESLERLLAVAETLRAGLR